MGLKAFSIQMDGVAIMAWLLPALASCVDPSGDGFVRRPHHISAVEGFWGLAKGCLAKFKGLPKHIFLCISKEPGGGTITVLLII